MNACIKPHRYRLIPKYYDLCMLRSIAIVDYAYAVKYARTRRIVDKKGRGRRRSSSLADEVRLISQRNSSIARAINNSVSLQYCQ